MDAFWLYLHILLLVFWVGTDIGVFIAAKWSERTALSIETRQTILQLGMVLDRLPRSALTLIIPSGCQLAVASGWLTLPSHYLLGMWLFAAVLGISGGFLSADPKAQEQSAKINCAQSGARISGQWRMYLLMDGEIPDWLALKVLAVERFSVLAYCGSLFKPGRSVGAGRHARRSRTQRGILAATLTRLHRRAGDLCVCTDCGRAGGI